jgi:hypothetical protein
MSIRTRSGGQAEKLAPSERDKHESIKIELKRTVDEEARKANEQQAKQTDVADSLGRRRAGLKIPADHRRDFMIRSGGSSSGGRRTSVSLCRMR